MVVVHDSKFSTTYPPVAVGWWTNFRCEENIRNWRNPLGNRFSLFSLFILPTNYNGYENEIEHSEWIFANTWSKGDYFNFELMAMMMTDRIAAMNINKLLAQPHSHVLTRPNHMHFECKSFTCSKPKMLYNCFTMAIFDSCYSPATAHTLTIFLLPTNRCEWRKVIILCSTSSSAGVGHRKVGFIQMQHTICECTNWMQRPLFILSNALDRQNQVCIHNVDVCASFRAN